MDVLTGRARFAEVFTAALRGEPCTVVGLHPIDRVLPTEGWSRAADRADEVLLAHCHGATLDIGCGPGRMTAHLASLGVPVLGIDIVEEAVAQTRERGAAALLRDVFDPLPGEGRWASALLADGNIGIGGDPLALLERVHHLLTPGGRVVCDLAEPGTGLRRRIAHLRCGEARSTGFPWALVGPEALDEIACRSGLEVSSLEEFEGRWYGVLTKVA